MEEDQFDSESDYHHEELDLNSEDKKPEMSSESSKSEIVSFQESAEEYKNAAH